MKTLIITFHSRNNLLGFAKILKTDLIPYSIINTPSNISSSCTLSLKIPYNAYSKIISILRQFRPAGFIGLFLLENTQTQRLF